MEMSEKTDELFSALSKMQGELENVHKAKSAQESVSKNTGKVFAGFKYADLGACIDAAKPVMAKYELAVSQLMGVKDGNSVLTTILTHSSGQWMRGDYVLQGGVMQGVSRAQDMGAAITYARRYCFAAIIGLAQEDDESKLKKEQDAAEAHAAQQAEADRKNYLDGKRHAYSASPNLSALDSYHASTIKNLRQQVTDQKLLREECDLRTAELVEIRKEAAKKFEQGNEQ